MQTLPLRGVFSRRWHYQHPPPEPEPLRLRPPVEPIHGDYQRSCHSTWAIYCHVTGTEKSDARMRRVLAKILGRPVETRKSLANHEWRQAQQELDRVLNGRDGGLHAQLFGHIGPLLTANRKALLPSVYGALLGVNAPCGQMAGSSREAWLYLLERLREHRAAGCDGGEGCSLLRTARDIAEAARRAA